MKTIDFHVTLKSAVFLTEAFMESGKPNMDCSYIQQKFIHFAVSASFFYTLFYYKNDTEHKHTYTI